jgi:hypothetical protein
MTSLDAALSGPLTEFAITVSWSPEGGGGPARPLRSGRRAGPLRRAPPAADVGGVW